MTEIVLVTGGTRGIGRAIAIAAAREGHDVAMSFASNQTAARQAVEDIEALGRRAIALRNGAATSADTQALVEAVEQRLGPVTALVNNAGITGGIAPFTAVTQETMNQVLAVNLVAPMLLSQAMCVRWLQRGVKGRIVNISSIAARTGAAGEYIAYAAAKGGVESFTRGLGREMAPHGIRVNAVAPGTTNTDIHAASGEPGRAQRIASRVPMGRVAEPQEIAQAVLWLLSARAGFVTGETVTVAGGM